MNIESNLGGNMRKIILVIALILLMTCAQAGPPILVDPDTGKYLGNLNRNPLDPDSIYNPIGRYGSKVSPDSINNPIGQYGSRISPDSPHNPMNRNSGYEQMEREMRAIDREFGLDPYCERFHSLDRSYCGYGY